MKFLHLNKDWNAQPNAPLPEVRTEGGVVQLQFILNSYSYSAIDGELGFLTFSGCKAWRLGYPNDEGWYDGDCRYGKSAPKWGEFYELTGPDPLLHAVNDWVPVSTPDQGRRHFLFYLRDETFECLAENWIFERGTPTMKLPYLASLLH
nr:hypothetical protein [Rhizobium wenxiniae]